MADFVRVNITGDRQTTVRLDAFFGDVYDELRAEIEPIGEELLALVQARTPSRTGELRAAERLRIFTDPNRIKAQVDVAGGKGAQIFAQAGALEYGAHRATKVSAHPMKLDHFWSRKLTAPMDVLVAAYTRTPNIAEVAFERGALAELAPEVTARLDAVVDRAAAAANT